MQESGCVRDSVNIITATGEGKGLFVQEAASCPARAKQLAVIQRAVTPRSMGERLGETGSPWLFEASHCIAPACTHNGGLDYMGQTHVHGERYSYICVVYTCVLHTGRL